MKRRDKQRIYNEWRIAWTTTTARDFADKHGLTIEQLDKIAKDGDAAARRS